MIRDLSSRKKQMSDDWKNVVLQRLLRSASRITLENEHPSLSVTLFSWVVLDLILFLSPEIDKITKMEDQRLNQFPSPSGQGKNETGFSRWRRI